MPLLIGTSKNHPSCFGGEDYTNHNYNLHNNKDNILHIDSPLKSCPAHSKLVFDLPI